MSDSDIITTDVSSIDDRRRIKALEAKNADLEHKLAAAMNVVTPAMRFERDKCQHFGPPIVAHGHPSVTCSACGVELDPYDVLRKIAFEEFNFCYTMNEFRREAEDLGRQIKRLKAQRAQLRRQVAAQPKG